MVVRCLILPMCDTHVRAHKERRNGIYRTEFARILERSLFGAVSDRGGSRVFQLLSKGDRVRPICVELEQSPIFPPIISAITFNETHRACSCCGLPKTASKSSSACPPPPKRYCYLNLATMMSSDIENKALQVQSWPRFSLSV